MKGMMDPMEPMVIVTGRAGQLLPEWKTAVRECHDRGLSTVTIVPEQYTLQAERELLQALGTPGLLTDEVLSPSRLRLRVCEQVGRPALTPLDELGRQMTVSCVMRDVKSELKLYGASVEQLGMPGRVAELLTELGRSGITPEQLRSQAKAEDESSLTGKRFTDLALILEAYEKAIGGRFTDEAGQQAWTAEHLAESGVLTDACVFVYGFDMLQPPFCRILLSAMSCAHSVRVLMVSTPGTGDGYIFEAQEQSLRCLRGMLYYAGLEQMNITSRMAKPPRAPGLTHLEENLFNRAPACL